MIDNIITLLLHNNYIFLTISFGYSTYFNLEK